MYWTGVLFTLTSLGNLISPYLKNLWRKSNTSDKNCIAKVEFTADDTDYKCIFDTKKMKWVLTSDVSISENEVIMFF